jgi:hypothetical protein
VGQEKALLGALRKRAPAQPQGGQGRVGGRALTYRVVLARGGLQDDVLCGESGHEGGIVVRHADTAPYGVAGQDEMPDFDVQCVE